MSDITRDDLRADISRIGSPHYGETREVTDAEALRALLTDECDRCVDGIVMSGHSAEQEVLCDHCGGRGWLPKDGVTLDFRRHDPGPGIKYSVVQFPLDWLEAEDEQE